MKDAATVVLFICAVAALPIIVRALVGTLPRTPVGDAGGARSQAADAGRLSA